MAKRAGGPKTEAGKLIVSKNAIKTGVYSELLLLPGESQNDFEALEAQFDRDFKPQDAVEVNLLQDLVEIAWKQYRLRKIEHAYLIQKLSEPFLEQEVVGCKYLSNTIIRDHLSALDLTDQELSECEREVDFAEKNISREIYLKSDFDKIQTKYPFTYKQLQIAQQSLGLFRLSDERLLNASIKDRDQSLGIGEVVSDGSVIEVSFGSYVLSKVIDQIETILLIRNLKKEIQLEISLVKNERYMRLMQSETHLRAHDDLRRAFSRILQEYQKHQDWKFRTHSIPMTGLPIYKTD